MLKREMREVNQAKRKKDAFQIMTGAPVYTEDLVPANALVVKLMRSPHAHAKVLAVDCEAARALPGVACVLTHEDVPHHRHSYAGESYPGNNPFDRVILDETVRYIGDPVAIVAAEDEKTAEKAISMIRVKYEVLKPVIDFETAETAETKVHAEDDYFYQMDVGGDLNHNILGSEESGQGDFEKEFNACPIQLDETYYTGVTQQAMMETFRSFAYYDQNGLLTIVSSTQVPFHARRITAMALGIPQNRVRVIKPRIGGGFGAKQSLCTEIYAAVVTMKTGKPAYICLTRTEAFSCGNTRHKFRVRVRLGATEDGIVRALSVDSLEDAGAYGEHAVNVVGLSGHKTLPLYSKTNAWHFTGKVVYTNNTPGGAFRGFGATQGCFAVESTVNKMALQLGLDPTEVRLKNIPKAGDLMPAYFGQVLGSTALDRCIIRGREMTGWNEKYAAKPFAHQVGPHRYRGMGMAVTMQGSGLSDLDNCSVRIQLNDCASYSLSIGATDMGTGCDTILAQMAADVLGCSLEQVNVNGVDTEHSPFDKGSYASSTTYVTGNAVVQASEKLLVLMKKEAASMMKVDESTVEFDGAVFTSGDKRLTLQMLGVDSVNGHNELLMAHSSFCSPVSPPPFVAGFAEVEVDTQTGEVTLCDFTGVVDCGTRINKALTKVQAEGGFSQGIGMALFERNITSQSGKMETNNFMQYKIPARVDVPSIHAEFEESYEPTGPFGAKSIGEVVINTPSPAIISAIRNAVGVELHSLPARAEDVWMELQK